ncbi:related to translation initiation factor 5A (eIF-5A) [Phialocephala subalpina]|uniref:Eukaryotic translation initiation factor 5A n=1 Tax=Phialocephala subalpina TaxID=576137 RepID=A0A1L7XPC6_9HELO|nr:related to translation initiation factor 5A (eIF-5A) [Phialocephala subalpina]
MSSEEGQYAAEATGNAEASLTYPIQASALRKGGYAILKSHPCKILEVTTAKPGKHGHAKCTFKGRDIFTAALVEDSHPSSHNMEVPIVRKTEWDVSYVTRDGFLSLFGEGGEKEDVKVPEGEVGSKIRKLLEDTPVSVTILEAMGQEMCMDAKAGNDD